MGKTDFIKPIIDDAVRGILDLLGSGRADEITDAMLDLGDPVMNARLNEALWQNYDLPMDYTSRMERAGTMNADMDAYHATTSDFVAFDPLKRGTATDSGWFGDADYFSPKPEFAEKFVAGRDGGSVIPAKVNRGNVYDWRAMEADRGGYGVGNNRDASLATRRRLEAQGFNSVEVSNPMLRVKGGISDDMWTAMVNADPRIAAMGRENVSAAFTGGMPRKSLDPYLNKEMLDLIPAQPDIEEIAIFDPANIRSRFARFDPRLAHLKNLNATLAGGAGVTGLLSMSPEEAAAAEIDAYLKGKR